MNEENVKTKHFILKIPLLEIIQIEALKIFFDQFELKSEGI